MQRKSIPCSCIFQSKEGDEHHCLHNIAVTKICTVGMLRNTLWEQMSTSILRKESFAHNARRLNLRNVSVPGSGGYQWAVIALRSLFWLHLTSGQDYMVGIPVSSLSLLVFWMDLRLIYKFISSPVSLSISCWSYPDPLAVSWPWAIPYLAISIKLV